MERSISYCFAHSNVKNAEISISRGRDHSCIRYLFLVHIGPGFSKTINNSKIIQTKPRRSMFDIRQFRKFSVGKIDVVKKESVWNGKKSIGTTSAMEAAQREHSREHGILSAPFDLARQFLQIARRKEWNKWKEHFKLGGHGHIYPRCCERQGVYPNSDFLGAVSAERWSNHVHSSIFASYASLNSFTLSKSLYSAFSLSWW